MDDARNRILDSAGRRGATSMRKAGYAAQFSSALPSVGRRINLSDAADRSRTADAATGAARWLRAFRHWTCGMKQRSIDAILIPDRDVHERIEQRIGEKMRLQSEVDQLGVFGVVVMLFGFNARLRQMLDRRPASPASAPRSCTISASSSTENCSVN